MAGKAAATLFSDRTASKPDTPSMPPARASRGARGASTRASQMTPAMSRTTAIVLSAMPVIIAPRWSVSAATWLAASSDRIGWASVPAITMIGAASKAREPAIVRFDMGSPCAGSLMLHGPRRYAAARGRGLGPGAASAGEAELAQHSDVVAAGPVLGDPAVLDAEDVDLLDGEAAPGGRPAQELARLGAPHGAAHHDAGAVAEGVIDVVGPVREGAAQPAHHPPDGLGSGSGVTPVHGRPAVAALIDAVRGDQLAGELEAAGPEQLDLPPVAQIDICRGRGAHPSAPFDRDSLGPPQEARAVEPRSDNNS